MGKSETNTEFNTHFLCHFIFILHIWTAQKAPQKWIPQNNFDNGNHDLPKMVHSKNFRHDRGKFHVCKKPKDQEETELDGNQRTRRKPENQEESRAQ